MERSDRAWAHGRQRTAVQKAVVLGKRLQNLHQVHDPVRRLLGGMLQWAGRLGRRTALAWLHRPGLVGESWLVRLAF